MDMLYMLGKKKYLNYIFLKWWAIREFVFDGLI